MVMLSDPLISIITALFGAVFLLMGSKPVKLIGLWFLAEFMCDYVTTGLGSATTVEIVTYRYLYAITSILFSVHVFSHRKDYPNSIKLFFTLTAIFTAANGIFAWFSISSDLYMELQAAYIITITGMEAIIIIDGFRYARNQSGNNKLHC